MKMSIDTIYSICKFMFVGLLAALLQFGIYDLMLRAKINYEWSSGYSFIVATIFAYIGNRLWTFRSRRKWRKEFAFFFATRLLMLALNQLLLFIIISNELLNPLYALLACIPIITLLNYVLGVFFVFK